MAEVLAGIALGNTGNLPVRLHGDGGSQEALEFEYILEVQGSYHEHLEIREW